MRTRHARARAALMLLAAPSIHASTAYGQEAMYTEAATMPSPGTFVLRQQYHYQEYGKNPNTGSDETFFHEWMSTLQFGVARGLAVRIDVPVRWRTEEFSTGDDFDKGVEELDLMLKWRVFQKDSGGVNTLRAAIMGGAEVPSGDDHDFSDRSIDPMIGGVVTLVRGRHGFNQDLFFKWNTGGGEEFYNFGGDGPDNVFNHGTAYLFRIAPDKYTPETKGAWYTTIEVNGIYETHGDYELLWAPGIMYEGRLFALEFMAQFPLYQDVHDRPELDFRVGMGVRFAF